jgi:UDP-N-acetylglucosamine 2-epimerase (non-hydrolysing)
MRQYKIITIMGTRPEVIKLVPVVKELHRQRETFDSTLVTTAQHRELLDQTLAVFGVKPDIDLGLMQQNQSLADFASRSLSSLSELLGKLKPDAILIQGDTTTVMMAALAAFYQGIMVGHIEAGLRSFDRRNPFPEEINRRIASCLTNLHFAPTERARQNLLREGVPEENVFVTGNTVVDALQSISIGGDFDCDEINTINFETSRILLVTAHRRENFGQPLRSICQALKNLISRFKDIEIVYPIHLNPAVQVIVNEELKHTERIHLIEPVSYKDLLRLMSRCYLLLTDSGGIQEEAPSFHKPVLILRELTERPEIIEANAGIIVGTDAHTIVETAARLLTDTSEYTRMSTAENPFGDGNAAKRIVTILAQQLRELS